MQQAACPRGEAPERGFSPSMGQQQQVATEAPTSEGGGQDTRNCAHSTELGNRLWQPNFEQLHEALGTGVHQRRKSGEIPRSDGIHGEAHTLDLR